LNFFDQPFSTFLLFIMSISTPRCDDQDIISTPGPRCFRDGVIVFLQRNPAVAAAVCLGAGTLVGSCAAPPGDPTYLFIVAVAGFVGISFGLARQRIVWTCCGLAVVFFVVGVYASVRELRHGANLELPEDYTVIEATLGDTLASGPGCRTFLLEQGQYGAPATPLPGYGRVIIRQENFACKAGDRIAFHGRIRTPRNRGNPGEFDWELHCRNSGIYWLASIRPKTQPTIMSHGPWYDPMTILFLIRDRMNAFLDSAPRRCIPSDYQESVRAILKAIVIGDLGEVSPRLYKSFSDSGLVHALSASGIHVGMVAMVAGFIVAWAARLYPKILLRFPLKKLAAAASIPAMIAYCIIVGGRGPAIRATIMGVMIAGAIILERKWQSANALAFAAVVVLFVYPLSLFTPSFLLSFCAVAGIMTVWQRFRKEARGDSPGTGALRFHVDERSTKSRASRAAHFMLHEAGVVIFASLGAVIATLPITWYFFRSLPVYTLFANLLADFLMTLALGFGLLASILSLASSSLGGILLVPADVCSFLVIKTAEFFAGLPFSVLRRAQPDAVQVVFISIFALAALLLLGKIYRRRSRLIALGLCISALFVVVEDVIVHSKPALEAYFLNVGKGDSIFLRAPGSKGILVDGGVMTEFFDAGTYIVTPFLYWAGVSKLDGIVMTHPDTDHIGGLACVVECIGAARIFWNPVETTSVHLENILSAARERKFPVAAVNRDSPMIAWGDARLQFLNAPATLTQRKDAKWKINNTSVVIRLDYGKTSFLLTGDLEHEGEEELLTQGLPLRADVLKVGHHGSKNSTSVNFLKAVAPKIAIISADYPRKGGLPNDDILQRLASFGIHVYWTGRDGAVAVTSDGQSLAVRTGRKRPL
jgi:competence protein ComEC